MTEQQLNCVLVDMLKRANYAFEQSLFSYSETSRYKENVAVARAWSEAANLLMEHMEKSNG